MKEKGVIEGVLKLTLCFTIILESTHKVGSVVPVTVGKT